MGGVEKRELAVKVTIADGFITSIHPSDDKVLFISKYGDEIGLDKLTLERGLAVLNKEGEKVS